MTLKTAVIGAGVMGAAAAYALSRRGAAVTLFEQFSAGHDRGSSHGATRLFRTAYFEHPDYVPLLKRAATHWRALEAASNTKLFEQCGVFMAGGVDSALMSGTLNAARDHGLPLERLTHETAAERFPWFALEPTMESLIEPEAGFIYADKAHGAFLAGAKAHGAELCDQCAVEAWDSTSASVGITANGERLSFDRIVVTPGAFAVAFGSALAGMGEHVSPRRKALFWTSPGEQQFSLENGFIPFGIEEADGRFFYGFPAIDGDGVKIGEHTGGAMVANPADEAPEAAAQAKTDLEAFLKRRAPGLSPAITKQQSCLYAMSPDEHFIIDRHPDDARIVIAMGFSGHGFKFAPVVGEALADLALTGATLKEFDFLKLSRFV